VSGVIVFADMMIGSILC